MKFTQYLRSITPDIKSNKWIIGGKRREKEAMKGDYAGALKKHDPELFKKLKEAYNENANNLKQQNDAKTYLSEKRKQVSSTFHNKQRNRREIHYSHQWQTKDDNFPRKEESGTS